MDKDLWKSSILDVVRRIADESYQQSAWFGMGTNISSPEEIYCELFDDFIYDDFLTSPDVYLTDIQRSSGLRLKEALNQYSDSVDFISDPERVFSDPQWGHVRFLAKEFLDAF